MLYQQYPGKFRELSWLWIPGILLLAVQVYKPLPLPREFAFGIPAALIVYGAIGIRSQQGKIFRNLIKFGDASYSTYLLHPFILQSGALLFISLGLTSKTAVALYALISITLIIPVSLLSYRYIEKVSRQRLNQWFFQPGYKQNQCHRYIQPSKNPRKGIT